MALDFCAEEITVTLTEDHGRHKGFATRKPGKPMTFTVAPRFGAARTRFVQGLIEKMGGGLIYLESSGGSAPASVTNTLVVPHARTGSMAGDGRGEGYLKDAAEFVRSAMVHNRKVVVYGSSRTRWVISVKCGRSSENLRDSETHTEVATRRAGGHTTRLRKEF